MPKWAKVALGDPSQTSIFAVAEGAAAPALAAHEDPQWLAWIAASADITEANKGEFVTDGTVVWRRTQGDLHTLRRQRLREAEALFDARTARGLPWEGKRIQLDEPSQARIQGVALLAHVCLTTGATWSTVHWIAADNSTVPLETAGDMLAMAQAAAERVIALRVAFRAAKDALLAAETVAGVLAIDLDSYFAGLD